MCNTLQAALSVAVAGGLGTNPGGSQNDHLFGLLPHFCVSLIHVDDSESSDMFSFLLLFPFISVSLASDLFPTNSVHDRFLGRRLAIHMLYGNIFL